MKRKETMDWRFKVFLNLDGYEAGYQTGRNAGDANLPEPPDRFMGSQRREWKKGWLVGNFNSFFEPDEEAPAAAREILEQMLAEVLHET